MINVGERITSLRKSKDWSQDEYAVNSHSIEEMVKLAKVFEVSVDFLLGEG
ncbi:MAG: helix-turn-helix domain-containing protein [Bacteroidota bacterium]